MYDPRPLEPSPTLRLRIRRPQKHHRPPTTSKKGSKKPPQAGSRAKPLSTKLKQDPVDDDPEFMVPTITHTLFCFAVLVGEFSDQELTHDERSKTRHIAGSVVSSLFHLRGQGCFVFPDLRVRTQGRWRLKISMFELAK